MKEGGEHSISKTKYSWVLGTCNSRLQCSCTASWPACSGQAAGREPRLIIICSSYHIVRKGAPIQPQLQQIRKTSFSGREPEQVAAGRNTQTLQGSDYMVNVNCPG